ncbi:MAG TPA: flagellar hook-length control protein FliK [Nocardioidaceae bacterium]|nr:flagellar hook-length control protein FliK [Nocardioidaceae bacterium]
MTDSDGDLHAGTTTPASGAGASGVPVPTAPNAPVSAAAPSAGGPAGGTSTAVPVPAQLQPSLVRLVSRGDGTHRMSLRLHPAELGEVRLTVTVKDGAVDVAMAAGPEAQDTLREGSAQLRAMLSGSGHTLGQLVVQNLPGPATPPAAGSGTAAQGGTQPGAGQGSPQGSAQGAPQGSAQGSGHGFGQPGQHAGQHAGQHQPGREWAGATPAATSPGGAPVVPPDRAPGPHAARGPRPGIDVRI